MDPLLFALFAAGTIILTSLVGVVTIHKTVGATVTHALPYLVSASSGLFAVVVITLLIEANETMPLVWTLGAALCGTLTLIVLSSVFPEAHHHHTDEECETAVPQRPHALRILVADAIHNIGDGIVLVPAFLASPMLGITVAVGIVVHEIAQELSEFFVLRAAGLSTKAALARNALAASTILIGVGIGAAAAETEILIGLLLAFSAGAFAYVIAKDLIPHIATHAKGHGTRGWHATAAALGVVFMTGLSLATPHEHAHHDHDTHDHEEEPSLDIREEHEHALHNEHTSRDLDGHTSEEGFDAPHEHEEHAH